MRKLVISLISVALLLVSFVTSTFAFIVISVETEVEEFNFDIEGYDGLLISLDGTNFQQDITSKQFKEKIAGTEEAFDELLFTGVTLKHDASKISLDTDNKALFVKDDLSTNVHTLADATANKDYLAFDLWLKVEISDAEHPTYNLKMTDKTQIDSEDYIVKLRNSLSTMDKDYVADEQLIVNPANAMRLGFSNEGVFTTYECNAPVGKAADLGSAAIEGGTGANDKTKNAMYTYYNNIHPLTPFDKVADANLEGFSNIKTSYTSDVVDTFEYSSGSYNVVKLTVYIWLEGWDADYLATVPTSNISVNLGFEIEKE